MLTSPGARLITTLMSAWKPQAWRTSSAYSGARNWWAFACLLVTPVPHFRGRLIGTTESIFVAAAHRPGGAGIALLRHRGAGARPGRYRLVRVRPGRGRRAVAARCRLPRNQSDVLPGVHE